MRMQTMMKIMLMLKIIIIIIMLILINEMEKNKKLYQTVVKKYKFHK
jgi:hypothetical protein